MKKIEQFGCFALEVRSRGFTRRLVAVMTTVLCLSIVSAATANEWTLRVNTGPHGSVEPDRELKVGDGEAARVTFKPDAGYRVLEVLVNGEPVDIENDVYAVEQMRRNKTLEVKFAPAHVQTLPFRETFMDVDAGRYLMGRSAWYGDFPDQSAEILRETRRPLVQPQPARRNALESETQVMHVFGSSATLYFDEGDEDVVWFDLRLRTDLFQEEHVTVEPETQMAFYVNGDGKVVLYHRNLNNNRPVWTVFEETNVENEEWLWLTIQADYGAINRGGPFFQMYVNGVLITHDAGRQEADRNAAAGGPWFAAVHEGGRDFNSLTVSGTGYLDELSGDSRHDGFPDRVHKMNALVAGEGGGRISHSGVSYVPDGWVKTYRLDAQPGHDVFDLLVDGESAGRETPYTFRNVSESHTVEAIFAPVIDVRWEGNGEVSPGGKVLRRFGTHLELDVKADEGHHITGVSVRRGLDAEPEELDEEFGQGFTTLTYEWGEVREPGALISRFAVDHHELVIESEWGGALLNGESVIPGEPILLPWGSTIRLTIEHSPLVLGDSRFTCRGWEGEGSIPAQGDATDTGELVFREDSSLIWDWVAEHRLHVTSEGPGAVPPVARGLDDEGQGWFEENATVEITLGGDAARPAGFRRWRGDVPAGRDRDYPLTVPIDEPRQIQAEFQ